MAVGGAAQEEFSGAARLGSAGGGGSAARLGSSARLSGSVGQRATWLVGGSAAPVGLQAGSLENKCHLRSCSDDDELVLNRPTPCQIDKHSPAPKNNRPASNKERTVEVKTCGLVHIGDDDELNIDPPTPFQ